MPIPDKIKIRDLVGKTVILDEDVTTRQCLRVPAGTAMRVTSVGRGLNLQSLPDYGSGVSYILTDVRKSDVSIPDYTFGAPVDPQPYYGALWLDRSEYNDYTWSQCSRCGKQLEDYKAVNTGTSSTDYTGVKTRFCPCCGSRMGVRTNRGKIVTGPALWDRYGLEAAKPAERSD